MLDTITCIEWRHTGFNVHSKVRAQTEREAERVGEYMFQPLSSMRKQELLMATEEEGKYF
jgi:hypothetical protein